MQNRRSWKFICNDWLDVTESDGAIARNIGVASPDDLNEFEYVFQLFLQQQFYDGHIWLSVFFRPIQSTFTTVQRLCTVFCLLMMTMLANAMFYRAGMISHYCTRPSISHLLIIFTAMINEKEYSEHAYGSQK